MRPHIEVVSDFDRIISRFLSTRHPRLFNSWPFLYPAEAFFAWLAAVKGIPAMFGIRLTISGPESGYPSWVYIGWGIMLVLSAAFIGTGLVIRNASCRVVGFKLLALATIQNLLIIFLVYGFHRPAYVILYCGFAIACAVKVISIGYADAVAHTILEEIADNRQAGP